MNNKMLKLHHISLQMPNQKSYFFNGINLEFSPGVYFLTGKNGIGKSTLFRIISGSSLPSETISGSIEFDGISYQYDDNNALPETYRQQVRHVVQKTDTMIVPEFSCEDNLRLALLSNRPSLSPLPAHEPLPDFFFDLGIELQKPVKQLSGGQRQIIAILMMLQKEARVLLLDEPTAALDQENADLVMKFVTKLAKEQDLIVLVITHDMDIIDRYGASTTFVINAHSDGRRFIQGK